MCLEYQNRFYELLTNPRMKAKVARLREKRSMEMTIRSDVFGLSSTKHLHRYAVLHPGNDVVMMWWLCHLISHIPMSWAQHLRPDSMVWPYHTYPV